MKRLVDVLGSVRLTVALLVGLLALFALGLAVPQKPLLQREGYEAWRAASPRLVAALEAARLTDVYRSPLATVLWGAFFLNLVFVMGRRLPGMLRRTAISDEIPDPATAPGFVFRGAVPAAGDGLARAAAFFEARGYAVHVGGERLRAVRNRWAPLATLAFHLSFFLVAAGAAASAATRFEGTVDLGQGEQFTGELGQYASPPRLPRLGRPPSARFIVEGIEPEVVGHVPVAIRVHLRDDRFRSGLLEVNHPYRSGEASFVFKNLGVAPAILVTDPDGNAVFTGLIRLNVLMGKTDRFTLLGREFTARFFPDYVRDGAEETSRTQEMRDPVLRLATVSPGGEPVTAALRPGDAMTVGALTLTFVDWRYWVRLYVRAERGIGIIWLGFGLGALGLAVRLLLYRREWIASAAPGGGLRLAARAEYYRALFSDDAGRLARALEAELTAPAAAAER